MICYTRDRRRSMFTQMHLPPSLPHARSASHSPGRYFITYVQQLAHNHPRIGVQHFPRVHTGRGKFRTRASSCGSPPTTYSTVQQYLQFMSQPFAYATNLELVAASQVYGLEFRVTLHGQAYPDPPSPHTCDVLYYPSSFHYVTLRYATSS